MSHPLKIELPPKLIPVFLGEAMYRGAYGGRGSAKTRSFCKMAAVYGRRFGEAGKTGVILCGREFQNSLKESSMSEVKAAIESELWLKEYYDVGENYIRSYNKAIEFLFVGFRMNIQSIKSTSKILLMYVDEAEPVSEEAWDIAIPTVREEGAEIWVTWNPQRKNSATHKRFRENPPDGAKIIELNWRDNPWFPSTLNATRLDYLTKRPDQYAHVWDGAFVSALAGAYYSRHLAEAQAEHRIGHVAADPLMLRRAFWDIGGTSGKSDACAIWIAQFIGREIRVIDYYETVGQPLASHVSWLHANGYGDAIMYLPHDGITHDRVFQVTYESELKKAGFQVNVIKNQGAGAANQRIEAVRRLFSSIFIDKKKCESGIDALGWYHEKRDVVRTIGLGPEHDWSSHAADAFGMMCVVAESVFVESSFGKQKIVYPSLGCS